MLEPNNSYTYIAYNFCLYSTIQQGPNSTFVTGNAYNTKRQLNGKEYVKTKTDESKVLHSTQHLNMNKTKIQNRDAN